MNKEKYSNFSVEVYGDLVPYNQVLSKARVRIFYKYGNRNGSYITDEFAEKLISTLPYSPVKGIYSTTEKDFTDHGASRDLGRIYGVVPQEPNFAWEEHLDKDGIKRTYACADVLLFTALYPEANQILDTPQSMEIYRPSIKGDWEIIDGEEYYVYTDGCFLGLQALGEKVEPCFEGASFFSLYDSLKELVEKMEKFSYDIGGQQEMEEKIPETAVETTDERVVVYEQAEEVQEETQEVSELRDETVVEEDSKEEAVESEVIEEDNLRETDEQIFTINEADYKLLNDIKEAGLDLDSFENLKREKSELEQKIVEFTEQNATLIMERDNFAKVLVERDELVQFKKEIENKQKQSIVDKYSQKLTPQQMENVTEHLDNYSVVDLEKELAYIYCSNFSFEKTEPKIPKVHEEDSLSSILGKYEKK